MLIQAQCQKDREKHCKINANDLEIRNVHSSTVERNQKNVEDEDIEMTETNDLAVIKDKDRTESISRSTKSIPNESHKDDNNLTAGFGKSTEEITPTATERIPSIQSEQIESNVQDIHELSNETIRIEDSVQEIDPYSTVINIDPRTYCKLGHFHLLLEDYPKGKKKKKKSFFLNY